MTHVLPPLPRPQALKGWSEWQTGESAWYPLHAHARTAVTAAVLSLVMIVHVINIHNVDSSQ